jgi:hypothetical protein
MSSKQVIASLKRVFPASNDESVERKRIRRMTIADVAAEIVAMRIHIIALESPDNYQEAITLVPELFDELLVELFQWFTQEILLTCVAIVCRKWHKVVNDNLTVMDCEPFAIHTAVATSFSKYTRLENLSLACHDCETFALSSFNTNRIHSLNLTGCNVSTLYFLAGFPNLRTFSVGSHLLPGVELKNIPATVTSLILDWCDLVNVNDLVHLSGLVRLEHLAIIHLSPSRPVDHTQTVFIPLELAPTLRTLRINGMPTITNSVLRLLCPFRALERLQLENTPVDFSFFKYVRQPNERDRPFEALTYLTLINCHPQSEIIYVSRGAPNLRHLEVRRSYMTTPGELYALKYLDTFEYTMGYEIIDPLYMENVFVAVSRCLNMHHFHLVNARGVTGKMLVKLANKDSKLETLCIGDCHLLTNHDFDVLRTHVPSLKSITHYGECPLLDNSEYPLVDDNDAL